MKRRDLLTSIQTAATGRGLTFEFVRQGGSHEVWSLDGLRIVIPRHRQIAEGTARSIRKQAAEKLGKDWWR